MVNKIIIDWIKNEQSKGYELNVLRASLMNRGYPQPEVDEAIDFVSNPPKKKPILIISLILILIIVGVLSFVLLYESPLSSSKIKSEMISAFAGIKNYAFNEKMNLTMEMVGVTQYSSDPMSITIFTTSEGVVDLENKAVYAKVEIDSPLGALFSSAESKTDVYFVNSFVYQKLFDQWVKSPLENEEDYFRVKDQMNMISKSKIEVIDKKPLHIRLIIDKQALAEKIVKKILKDTPELTDQFDISYAKAIEKVETEYWLDQNFRITRSKSKIIINLDETSIRPKEAEGMTPEQMGGGMKIIVDSLIDIHGYNSQSRVILPAEAKDAISPEEAAAAMFGSLFSGDLPVVQEEGITDCQDNWNCLIESSKTCSPSKLIREAEMSIFGLIDRSVMLTEIKGLEDGKCISYENVISKSVRFEEETIQQMLDSGLTQEEIEQAEKEINASAQETLYAFEKTCTWNNKESLTSALNSWSQGSFDSGNVSCKLLSDGTSECTTTGGDYADAVCAQNSRPPV